MGMFFKCHDDCGEDCSYPQDTVKTNLEQELRLAKAAALEWRDKYENAERRIVAVWDAALHEARMRLGHHVPRCYAPCEKCWFYDEIAKMMRGDANNYIPVKERLSAAKERLLDEAAKRAERDDSFFYDSYEAGVNHVIEALESMIARNE